MNTKYKLGNYTDFRTGKVYKTVHVGKQLWLAENLNTNVFLNGDIIPEAKSNEDWLLAGKEGKPAWCYYNNDSNMEKKYGKLYNWFAVIDKRGLAPEDWQVPSEEDWNILINYLGGTENTNFNMRSLEEWSDRTGTNETGFNAFPAGRRSDVYGGDFQRLDADEYEFTSYWSTTEGDFMDNIKHAISFTIQPDFMGLGDILQVESSSASGFSVRCCINLSDIIEEQNLVGEIEISKDDFDDFD